MMQHAIPYTSGRAWASQPSTITERPFLNGPSSSSTGGGGGGGIGRAVAENPVVVVGRQGCCMIHVVKRLLLGQGVNPTVCEVGDDTDETALLRELISSGSDGGGTHHDMVFPAVFIGGQLVGGLDRLMAVHISGDLVPKLKEAGALWL